MVPPDTYAPGVGLVTDNPTVICVELGIAVIIPVWLYADGFNPEIRTYLPTANPVEDETARTGDAPAVGIPVILVEVAVDKSKLIAWIGFAPLDG
jgi:hypothetical protein